MGSSCVAPNLGLPGSCGWRSRGQKGLAGSDRSSGAGQPQPWGCDCAFLFHINKQQCIPFYLSLYLMYSSLSNITTRTQHNNNKPVLAVLFQRLTHSRDKRPPQRSMYALHVMRWIGTAGWIQLLWPLYLLQPVSRHNFCRVRRSVYLELICILPPMRFLVCALSLSLSLSRRCTRGHAHVGLLWSSRWR